MKSLKIVCLYPNEMNIYGDHGNLLTVRRRIEWHGLSAEIVHHEPNRQFDNSADIIIGGGGQDSGQDKITGDLMKIGDKLHELARGGTPMLMICGLYQLFGHYFETHAGHRIDGIGIFDATTIAGARRLIGNVVIETNFGLVVGYENHSGLTYLSPNQPAFGRIKKGAGNNGKDKSEGARINNVFGSYLHGPILPKNPRLVDELIRIAAMNKFGDSVNLRPIDDSLADQARKVAMKRPR